MEVINIIKDIIVYIFIYILPLIIFLNIRKTRGKKNVIVYILIPVYIALSLFTQNLLPFILVVLIIFYMKKAYSDDLFYRDENSIDYRYQYYRYSFNINSFKILKGLKLTLFSYLITMLISIVEAVIYNFFNLVPKNQEVINIMADMPLKKFLLMIPITVLFAPVLEEFIFRWLFFENIFKKRVGTFMAVLLSSSIFAIAHFNLKSMPILIWISIYNCYLIEKKGYWYSVFNHCFFNSITTFILLIDKFKF
ncbi:MAG: family intrarane metalloprotease [Clostridiaceae bacterium]|jgi:membrane protease YdiL (CAAX protease family)|nr:family intrarane metalloprotease [Clostridiaceae bacterium]